MTKPDLIPNLIGLIYDTIEDPGLWPQVLDAFSELVGATSMHLHTVNSIVSGDDTAKNWITSQGFDPAGMRPYVEYYANIDIYADAFARRPSPPNQFISSEFLVPLRNLKKSESYNDYYRHYGAERSMGAYMTVDNNPPLSLSAFQDNADRPFESDALELANLIVPHFLRALQVSTRLGLTGLSDRLGKDLLSSFPMGVFVLGNDGLVLQMNEAADRMVSQSDGLRINRHGRCHAADPDDDRKLHAAIGSATQAASNLTRAVGGSLGLRRPSGLRPLAVLVSPLPGRLALFNAQVPAALMFASDPEQQTPALPERLRTYFGLTVKEADLAAALAMGQSLNEFADSAGITQETARWYLKRIFAKTETTRQSDLVRLVLTSPATLHPEVATPPDD